MGAVPFQEAKCALDGKRVMSPTSTSSRAAPDGPIPVQLRQMWYRFRRDATQPAGRKTRRPASTDGA
jgi:hypothetical protein